MVKPPAKAPSTGGQESGTRLPAYLHIVRTISDRIASGVYGPGAKLPSEAQLCVEFAVSPMTVRRALVMLADKGVVTAEQGRGTFVRSFDLSDSVFTLEQLTGEWLDGSTEVRLLSASTVKADAELGAVLGVPVGRRLVYLRRLVVKDETPAVYHKEYVIFDLQRPLVESQLKLTSLHGLLQANRGHGFPGGEITLCALPLEEEAASALDQPVGAPALCLEHLSRDSAGVPVSWGRFLLRYDLFRLRARLGRG
ncbi:MAG: GntR family transcriptional regulator [Thermoleophilia bacterium]|nr:GntR family transcriptional regulator [Thermoleophilia bacterium]